MPDRLRGGRRLSTRSLTRRSFLIGASAAGISVAAYSGLHARHELEITHRTFAIRNLPDAFVGFRFVQITDIHLEEYTEPWFLEEVVRATNKLNPELVVLTGDFVSRGPATDAVAHHAAGIAAEILEDLHAPQRFAILGNHDVAVGADHVIAPLEAHGTPVLVDSYIPIERGSDYIWLCGTDDAGTRDPDLNLAIPAFPRTPVILLCHEPDYVDHVVRHPRFPLIDLMLSGHTHGGQVRLPGIGPLILPPMGKKYVQGLFNFHHMQLYVNRGVGTVGLPFRLNCPAELCHITLVRA
ncbi:MAG TPA: metallophosphoesterase [Acidobacteriaceae bacterium]|nr:metallophosphoesterase [Acidobacteriaceae bacterium]